MMVKVLSQEEEDAGVGRMACYWRGEGKEAQYPFTVDNAALFWRRWQESSQDPFPKLHSWTAADIPEQKLLNII